MFAGFDWLLLVLAAGRLTRLLVSDDIMEWLRKPFLEWKEEEGGDILYPHPRGAGIRRFIGELLSCYWCTGIWASIILYSGFFFWPVVFMPVILVLSIAYGASIIESLLRKA